MSWLNDGLSPAILSHLKGQIKNFTQEVLSDGIIEDSGKLIGHFPAPIF
jgi:hypothetical protein